MEYTTLTRLWKNVMLMEYVHHLLVGLYRDEMNLLGHQFHLQYLQCLLLVFATWLEV